MSDRPPDSQEFSVLRERVQHAHERLDQQQEQMGLMQNSLGKIEGSLEGIRREVHSLPDRLVTAANLTASQPTMGAEMAKTLRWFVIAVVVMGLAWTGFNSFSAGDGQRQIEAERKERK